MSVRRRLSEADLVRGVLLLHGISTLSSYRQYLDPFNNLLFFAAWPMLAACFALYLLRGPRYAVDRGSGHRPGAEPGPSCMTVKSTARYELRIEWSRWIDT